MEGPHPSLILQLVFLLVLLGAHCTLSRRENRQQDGENYVENQRRGFESPVKEWKNKRGGKGDSETETQPLSVHRRRNWDDGRAQQLEAHAGKPPKPDGLGKRERNTKARETIQNTKENAREKNIAFMGGETQSKRNANVKKINGGNIPGSEARRRNTKVHKTKSQTYKVRKRLEDDHNRNKKLRKKKFPKKAESEKNYYKKHRTGDSRRSKSTNTLKNVQKTGKKTNKKTRNKNTFDEEEERKNRVHRTGGKTAYEHGSKEVEDIARTEKQAKGEPRSEEESPERKQRKNKKKNNSRKIANNRRKAGKWGRKKHPNQKTRGHLKDHINKIKSQTKKWMTRRKSKSRTDAAASGRHRQTDIQAKNIGNYQNQTLKQTRTLITDRKHQERPRGQTRGFDYPMYRLSTCKMTHTLTANEPFLLTSDSSRFARSCFNTFKGPPGSRLTFSCPVFALGSKGCKAERIQIKEPGKKWKFCKTEVVFLESLGDTLTVQHRRKNLAKKDCPGVFVCEVAVAKGTEPPTAPALLPAIATSQFDINNQFTLEEIPHIIVLPESDSSNSSSSPILDAFNSTTASLNATTNISVLNSTTASPSYTTTTNIFNTTTTSLNTTTTTTSTSSTTTSTSSTTTTTTPSTSNTTTTTTTSTSSTTTTTTTSTSSTTTTTTTTTTATHVYNTVAPNGTHEVRLLFLPGSLTTTASPLIFTHTGSIVIDNFTSPIFTTTSQNINFTAIATTSGPKFTTAPNVSDFSTTTTGPSSTTTMRGSTTTMRGSTTTMKGSTTTMASSTTTMRGSTTTMRGSTTTMASSTTTMASSTTTMASSTTTTTMKGSTTTMVFQGNSTLVGSGILPVLPVIGGTPTGPSGGQIGVPAPIALPNPIGLPAPIAPPKPIGGPAPIAPPKPIGGPTPIAPPKPIGLPAPIAPPKPIGGPTPIAPPKPIGGPAPIAPPKPIGGPVPIAPPKPIGLPAPIAPPKPIGGPVPIAPPKPIGGPTPIAPPKPIGGPAPIAPPKPIGGPVPIAPPKPIGGPAPIAPPKPIGGPAPIAPPKPIGGPTPIAPPKPIGGPAPIAPPKPIGGPAPIAPPKPIGGPAPIAPPNPPPGGQGPSPPRLFCSKCTPGHITVSRIVGGEPASVGEMPWQAKLIVSGVMCSGTLIMPSWVITAAHCYRNGYRDTDVTLGEHDLDVEEPGSVVLKINKVIPHPKFDSFTMEHDIALVELKSPVTFSDRIMPICLAQSQDFGDFGTAIASGWGHNSYGGSSPQVLHKVTLDIISNKACDDLYGGLYDIFDTMMCTYTENKDACQGDSGGPLVVQAPDGQWVLAGITSFGYRCAHKDSPGIFTRISKYHDWISANTYQENC
nr:uncharacterized protein LOC123756133 [Procambarus clarkii]